jgi:hypothetical protein
MSFLLYISFWTLTYEIPVTANQTWQNLPPHWLLQTKHPCKTNTDPKTCAKPSYENLTHISYPVYLPNFWSVFFLNCKTEFACISKQFATPFISYNHHYMKQYYIQVCKRRATKLLRRKLFKSKLNIPLPIL